MSEHEAIRVSRAGGGWPSFVTRWWQGDFGLAGIALRVLMYPAQLAYRAVIAARNAGYDRGILTVERGQLPVVSVGNISAGGTGKTPFAGWLVNALERRGARPALLHGGYSSDEPALHQRWHPSVPVFAQRDRVASVRAAAAAGARIAVLDDGFQHRRLARDVEIVLVAAEDWATRWRLLPIGPWREPASALRRAGLIVVTRRTANHETAARIAAQLRLRLRTCPVAIAWIRPIRWSRAGEVSPPPADPALAVTGIARPELFVENSAVAGARVDELLAFPDHHRFTVDDVRRMQSIARGRPIVTTAKDAVKLARLEGAADVWVLEQTVEIESGMTELMQMIDRIVP
ncbi:MAG: tetraacyldisaccharide 4'-kinase [Longimicrobiales bacterium]